MGKGLEVSMTDRPEALRLADWRQPKCVQQRSRTCRWIRWFSRAELQPHPNDDTQDEDQDD